jgi:hypothetical protein
VKREYAVFYAGASRFIATPLSVVLLLLFIPQYFTSANPKDLYPLCITAFGVSIAMAQLAFRFIPQVRKEEVTEHLLFAGEKFSLCALLVLQLILIVFCKDSLTPYIKSDDLRWWAVASNVILGGLWSLISASAIWCWYWAYCAFHDQLWLNWKERIRRINEKKS